MSSEDGLLREPVRRCGLGPQAGGMSARQELWWVGGRSMANRIAGSGGSAPARPAAAGELATGPGIGRAIGAG